MNYDDFLNEIESEIESLKPRAERPKRPLQEALAELWQLRGYNKDGTTATETQAETNPKAIEFEIKDPNLFRPSNPKSYDLDSVLKEFQVL